MGGPTRSDPLFLEPTVSNKNGVVLRRKTESLEALVKER